MTLSVLKEFVKVIKSNKHKTPSPELNENLNLLKKFLDENEFDRYYVYTDLLAQFREYLDYYNIDTSKIKKSILDQIEAYHNISILSDSKSYSDNEDDEINDEVNDEINDEEDNNENNDENINNELNNELENKANNELNNCSNKLNNCVCNDLMNNLNIALGKALSINNTTLTHDIVKSINILESNQ